MPMTSRFNLAVGRALMLLAVMSAGAQARNEVNKTLEVSLLMTGEITITADGGQSGGH